MGPRFTCRAKKTAKHRKAPFWLSELCQFVVSQWNKLCSFTACFIQGASSIWSKALLAASRSTVKPPATGGHPLKNQDRIENSVSGYRKAQFDFPSTSAWGLANPPGFCKARDEAGSRLKHGRYFTVEGRNQWEKVKKTLRWNPSPSRMPVMKFCGEDLVAFASLAVAVSQLCSFGSSSWPMTCPRSGAILLTKQSLRRYIGSSAYWDKDSPNWYEKCSSYMQRVTCLGRAKAKLESQPAEIFRSTLI